MSNISDKLANRTAAAQRAAEAQKESGWEQPSYHPRFASLRGETTFTYGHKSFSTGHSPRAEKLKASLARKTRTLKRPALLAAGRGGLQGKQPLAVSRDGGGKGASGGRGRNQSQHDDEDQQDESLLPSVKTLANAKPQGPLPENKLRALAARFPAGEETARAASVRGAADDAWLALLDAVTANPQHPINAHVCALRMDELDVQQHIGPLPQTNAIALLRERKRGSRTTREATTTAPRDAANPRGVESSAPRPEQVRDFNLLFPLLLLHSRMPRVNPEFAMAKQTSLLYGAKPQK